jgi:hypothetical protein
MFGKIKKWFRKNQFPLEKLYKNYESDARYRGTYLQDSYTLVFRSDMGGGDKDLFKMIDSRTKPLERDNKGEISEEYKSLDEEYIELCEKTYDSFYVKEFRLSSNGMARNTPPERAYNNYEAKMKKRGNFSVLPDIDKENLRNNVNAEFMPSQVSIFFTSLLKSPKYHNMLLKIKERYNDGENNQFYLDIKRESENNSENPKYNSIIDKYIEKLLEIYDPDYEEPKTIELEKNEIEEYDTSAGKSKKQKTKNKKQKTKNKIILKCVRIDKG